MSRELSRNKNRFGKYGWCIADEKARVRRGAGRKEKLAGLKKF